MSAEKRMFYQTEVDASIRAKNSADVIIMGGGMAGPGAAASLEEQDPTVSTIVVDGAGGLARGASTAAAECFRSGWSPRVIAEQMKYSLVKFLDPVTHFGKDGASRLNVRRRGYLYLGEEGDDASFRDTVALMRSWGITGIEHLDNETLHKEFPWVPPHFVTARVDRDAGWLNSSGLAELHAEKTKNARFFFDTPAEKIVTSGGKVIGVLTSRGMIYGDRVVIAAGPGSSKIAQTAGVSLPIEYVARQSFDTTYRDDQIPAGAPFVIAPRTHIYFRPQGDGLFFGWAVDRRKDRNSLNTADEPPPLHQVEDEALPPAALEQLRRQFHHPVGSGFGDRRYLNSKGLSRHIGYYGYRRENHNGSPFRSEREIIDETEIPGLYVHAAKAGHGIMTLPAGGHIAASLVLGRTPEIAYWSDLRLGVPVVEHELGSGL